MYGGLRSKVGYKPYRPSRVQNRPSKYSPFYDLQGGINTTDPSHAIKDNQLRDIYNCSYSTWGLTTRLGKEKYTATPISGATSIRGLHSSYATGSRIIVAADDKGKVYEDDGAGSFTSIQSGLTVTGKYFFHDWRSYTFFCNEQDGLYRWDGSNCDLLTGAPTGFAGIVNAEARLFGWKLNSNNLYFCAQNDETTWDTASEYSGFIIVPQIQGDFIVGVVKQGRTIVVFKNNSIWRYYINGLPRNWTRELVSDALGLAGKYAYDSIQDTIFFMGDDGRCYMLTDKVKLISALIDTPDINRWGLPTDLNIDKKYETVCKYMPSKRTVRWVYNDVSATTDYPNKYVDYDITGDRWTRGNLDGYCMCINSGKDDNGYMYVGNTTDGYIYQFDSGTSDDGTAIDAYFITKDYDLGVVDAAKIINTVYISNYPSGNYTITLTEYRDFDSSGTNHTYSVLGSGIGGAGAVWDTAVWDTDVWGGGGLVRTRIDLGNNKAYYVSFKIRNAVLDNWFEIRGLGVKYQYEVLI